MSVIPAPHAGGLVGHTTVKGLPSLKGKEPKSPLIKDEFPEFRPHAARISDRADIPSGENQFLEPLQGVPVFAQANQVHRVMHGCEPFRPKN